MSDYTPVPHGGGEDSSGDHPHRHGRPASWVLISVIIAAFVMGGAALIAQLWWLFWIAAGIVLLSIPTGRIIRIMDDTVVEGGPGTSDRLPSGAPGPRLLVVTIMRRQAPAATLWRAGH